MCPHSAGQTQFGTTIKFNEFGSSIVVSAPTGMRYSSTTFDFTDDELDNDTVFDNNATQWVDTFTNAGAVYMFDYLTAYNEDLTNPGKFAYAQSTNARNIDYGSQPYYGTALDYNNNRVTVGTPNFSPTTFANDTNGQVVTYASTSSENDWAVFRSSNPVVDVNGIGPIQIFSAETNNTLINLDYFDPLQGKLLGAVRENIDVISNTDPASYNSVGNTQAGIVWGPANLGTLWFDTTNVRFLNYHQNDIVYNSQFWGAIFPGSDVAIYSWVASNVPPAQYSGPGVAFNIDDYVVNATINAEGAVVPVYYFWARNTNIVNQMQGKTLADSTLQSYIAQPQASGISYFSPLQADIFAIYNCFEYVNANDSILHIGYATGTGDDVPHTQYNLIRAGAPDDFLPGLPNSNTIRGSVSTNQPTSLYARMLDSLSGTNVSGAVVPDPFLPLPVRTGVLVRPRQSFFYDRLGALSNYIVSANKLLLSYPFVESSESVFLYQVGEINPSTNLPFFQVDNYVIPTNWWAPGYNNNTKSSVQVPIYADLATLNVAIGTIATVSKNGNGYQETYVLDVTGNWVRIGLQYGTIQISDAIYDYANNGIGFGNNFFDTDPYDAYPSEETRYIVRALNEELPGNLLIYRNESLILLFEYIQAETVENQNFLPWLNKTSLVDVSHTIRELLPLQVFQSDNQLFLEGYLNEVKPYHVVIKDFLFKYTGTDVYEGDITDFDLPAQYNTTVQQFITPELVYSDPNGINQYLPSDPIWQTAIYNQWFNNYGLSIVGENNYQISTLESYLALNTNSCYVKNVYGFPVVGTITIGTEQIGYSSVNLATNQLLGMSRGVNGTQATQHIPGEEIYIDLPPVLVLNSGRGYSNPPRITAYIDTSIYPAPREVAEFQAIMNLDKVIGVTVINPGSGYVVLPTISIDPAYVVVVNSLTQVNITNNTIELSAPLLQTGDLVVYSPATGSTVINGLLAGQKYFVNVLESIPTPIIALYSSYLDAVNDHNRVLLTGTGTGYQNFSVGAVASCVSSAVPVRENSITLRFDRTTYTSQVTDWQPANYYGSFYAGSFSNSELVSSSSILLQSTEPNISTILASAEGAPFEILEVTNNQVLTWSSRTRNTIQTYGPASLYPNTIRVNPSTGGASVKGTVGSTVGFYIGMPIKFTGETVGNLVNNITYYVKSLVQLPNSTNPSLMEETGFTISDTVDNDGNPGSTFVLTTATVPTAGLLAYPGEVTNTAIMTINYDGIRNATATTSGTNYVTVQLTPSGQNGTTNFYVGLPIFFTGTVFGGISANEIYYITTVVDEQTFTMSPTTTPLMLEATVTTSSNDSITCSSTLQLSINEPIIFTGAVFGGIVAGRTYYVRELFTGNTSFSIAETINGAPVALSDATGSCMFTSQVDTVMLSTGTGSMTLNVNLSINPGQIDGQEFTLYQTSNQYTNKTGTLNTTSLVNRGITATLSTVNRVCLSSNGSGITNIYANMQFNVDANIGGLTTSGGPYTVTSTGTTSVNITNTSASGNWLTIPTTNGTNVLYVGMPLYFTGTSLGGIILNIVYYVHTIDGSPPSGSSRFKIAETATSVLPFVLTTQNGDMVGTGDPYITVINSLSTATIPNTVTLTQYINPSNYASFAVSYILGGYRVISEVAGSGYAVDNQIKILGTSLGGATPLNDLLLTVDGISLTGQITNVIASGTPAGTVNQYYLGVVSANEVAVYSDPNLNVPVSGQNFPYSGITSTTVTGVTASNDNITVIDSTIFNVSDPIVFTGNVFGGVTIGQTYYILTKPSATAITISTTIGGSTFNITANAVGTMTMAKSGDYALLPEPFYFDSSIVKYNNRVYQCIVSNNDSEFIFGKWELLNPGSSKLNALDRIIGYYQPTVNMPGVDLTQLVTGITYPNSTYMGNAFAPDEEYTLDTILLDQPFYPTGINLTTVLYNNARYIAASDSIDNSSIHSSIDGETWTTLELANTPIGLYDIVYAGGRYVLTGSNSATPILLSADGITFGTPSSTVPSLALNNVVYNNGLYVAVGSNIITSTNADVWTERYNFTNGLTNTFYGVSYVNTGGYTGYVAVGTGQYILNSITVTNTAIIYSSVNGINWNQVSFTNPYGLRSIASNGQTIVAVGEHGIIYTSFNTVTWFAQASGTVRNLTNIIWDSVNSLFIVVGDNGTILTSPIDGGTWTIQTSGTSEDLTSIAYNNVQNEYIVVGDNNTVLHSSNASVWTLGSVFSNPPTIYNVQGDPFTSGYGPEELVPGVVTDTVTMTVVTRPGTNWEETVYQHVGYNSVSLEIKPTSGTQLIYSFANAVTTPTQISVFVIDYITNLSTRVYEEAGYYTVDWVNQQVILDSPITFVSPGIADTLRIDVYETGNGDQLVKANTQTDPIRLNTTTGFQEILLNANYSAGIYQGSGLIRPTTDPYEATAISTNSTVDTITFTSVENFVLNGAIRFSGEVFGNIVEDQIYYVKTISYISNRITISETLNVATGTAGATFPLATATGSMQAIIQIGTGTQWSPPAVYHNGSLLVLGHSANATRTKSSNNAITTNTTGDFVVDAPITFSANMFGGIEPGTTYYIKSIVDNNEFTISETVGGPVFELTDATGVSIYITSDYSIGLADNGINATLIFANTYDETVDYISYTFLGETLPVQYGYTLPQTQVFAGNASTASFALDNYVSGDNPTNAIVEINGLRQTESAYTISPITNTVLFNSPPPANSTVAVTTYNSTDRQYFSTQYGITGSPGADNFTVTVGATVNRLATYDENSPNIYTFDEDTPQIVAWDEQFNYLTLSTGTTASLTINSTIVFSGSTFGGIVAGQVYYIKEILNSTDFIISTQVDGPDVIVTSATGTMTGTLNGLTVANITGIDNAIAPPSAILLVSQTIGGASDYVVCNSTALLVSGQPIIFKSNTPTVTFGNINVDGQYYFVGTIVNSTQFTILDQFGATVNLTNDTGSIVGYAGGLPTIRVTTGINHNLAENTIIRIDGTVGSIQLNNNTYYAKIVTDKIIDLYLEAYNPELNASNFPVTLVSTYTSGGYVWTNRVFTVAMTTTISTTATGNRITAVSTQGLVPNTPIYFTTLNAISSDNVLGGIQSDVEYYVYRVRPEIIAGNFIVNNQYQIIELGTTNWNTVAGTSAVVYAVGDIITAAAIGSGTGIASGLQEFTITENLFPNQAEFTVTNATGKVNVSEFQQVNVDRLWVTINGYRLPSSSLRINPYNNLSILATIETGDEVIITSMMPTATPNEETYLLNVSTSNQPSVYRANVQTRTWLTRPLLYTDSVIYLNDASRVTDNIIQSVTCPAVSGDGYYYVGLTSNKNAICHLGVFNNTTGIELDQTSFEIVIVDTAPILQITNQVTAGDLLTITSVVGRLLFVNGEQIIFNECDLTTNSVSQLVRGANGTGTRNYIPLYSEAYGIIPSNRMTDILYNQTWNPIPGIYNPVDGDPLQIAYTEGANFLRADRN